MCRALPKENQAMSTSQQLQQAFQLIKAGNKTEAARILVPIVRSEPNNADAWWLLSNAVTNVEQQRRALEKVLSLRPDDDRARRKLAQVTGGPPPESVAPTVMLPKSDMLAPRQDPFAPGSGYASDDPFAGIPASGGYSQDPFTPVAAPPPARRPGQPPMASPAMMAEPPKKRRGCNCCLVVLVILLLLALACVAAVLFAGSQVANLLGANTINDIPSVILGTSTARPGSPMDQALRQVGITDGNFGQLQGTLTAFPGELGDLALTAQAMGTAFGGDVNGAVATAQAALAASGLTGDALATAQAALSGDTSAMATANALLGSDPAALAQTAQAALGASGLDLGAISAALSTANIGDSFPEGVFTERGAIAVGENRKGTVNQSGGDVYTFSGTRGQVVNISVTVDNSSSLDPYLRIYDPDNLLSVVDDDGGGYPNALLTYELPADGEYRLVVTSFGGMSSGEYTLAISQGE
jgi:hypothetical protein